VLAFEKTVGWWVVAEPADFAYLAPGTPREVGPVKRETALALAQQCQQEVDRERAERLAPYR
jgi:hypothetical protein